MAYELEVKSLFLELYKIVDRIWESIYISHYYHYRNSKHNIHIYSHPSMLTILYTIYDSRSK